jgi:hypothetical protein
MAERHDTGDTGDGRPVVLRGGTVLVNPYAYTEYQSAGTHGN